MDWYYKYMDISWNRGTPSSHPFLDGIVPKKNHPAIWVSPFITEFPPYEYMKHVASMGWKWEMIMDYMEKSGVWDDPPRLIMFFLGGELQWHLPSGYD